MKFDSARNVKLSKLGRNWVKKVRQTTSPVSVQGWPCIHEFGLKPGILCVLELMVESQVQEPVKM